MGMEAHPMKWDQQQQIGKLLKAFGFLQILLLDEGAHREEIESECQQIQRQLSALSKVEQEKTSHSEKVEAELKLKIQTLSEDLDFAIREKATANAKAENALQEARRQRHYREAIEDENRGLVRQVKSYTHPNFVLDVVDDIQVCPNCGEQEMDREADDSCTCRYCLSRFMIDYGERHPF
jgi:NADH pyrophosphatase NudC (nudix superfamily)